MTVKAIIFDWGNVLGPINHQKACEVFSAFSEMPTDKIYKVIFESGIEKDFDEGQSTPEQFYSQVCEAINVSKGNMSLEECKIAWQEVLLGDNKKMECVLHYIKNDVKMLLLSNTNVWHWEVLSKSSIVKKFFSSLWQQILSFKVHCRKPDDLIYHEGIRRCGYDPREILYIDDIPKFAQKFGNLGGQHIVYHAKEDSDSLLSRLSELKLII